MEVHHHAHTPRKKWTHYFWEFFMLFLAVTLGFFVENQREHYIEHRRAKQYATLLKLDLANDTMRLNEFISNKDNLANKSAQVLNFYQTPIDKITLKDFNHLKNIDIDMSVFESQNPTYIQLQHSGNLRYFTNTDLVLHLAFYELAIKKYQSSWDKFSTSFGGLNSEHFLQQYIISEKFRKEHSGDSSDRLLKNAGYNFKSWEESAAIKSSILNGLNILNSEIYPSLKKTATDLIVMINKEYHLK